MFCLLITILSGSCDQHARFEVPQPEGVKDITSIPSKLQGRYFAAEDSSWLQITERTITRLKNENGVVAKSDLDSAMVVEGNHFTDLRAGISGTLKDEGDSVLLSFTHSDTLLSLSNDQILRRFKGHYFLNRKAFAGGWTVHVLEPIHKNSIQLQELTTPEDIQKLEELSGGTEIRDEAGEVSEYRLRPTRKQLKQLMKYNFRSSATYLKIKEDQP